MPDLWMPAEEDWPGLSMEHLEETLAAANVEMRKIEHQLGDKNREVDGRRMNVVDHNEWRQKAKFALLKKREEYTRLRNHVKARRRLADEGRRDARALASALMAREMSATEILRENPRVVKATLQKCWDAAMTAVEASDA